MKKLLSLFCIIGCGLMLSACGGNAGGSDAAKSDKKIEMETKDYIQSAIDKANLIADCSYMQTENGETYFDDYCLNHAYAYYGKDVKQLRQRSSGTYMVAVLEDGSVYCGNTLVTDEYEVKDVLWNTDIGANAYMITEDGHVLSYGPNSDTTKKIYGCNELTVIEGLEDIVAGCRCRSDLIFLSKDGKSDMHYSSYHRWDGCEIDGWKDVVVMACTYDETEGTNSIGAIAADGKVYATGDYAEEILSWGNLAYLTMDEGLIVGLKEDGTLAYAGKNAEAFSKIQLSGVEAVRVYDDFFVALTEDGFVRSRISSFDGEFCHLSTNEPSDTNLFYMDADGNINEEADNVWEKSKYAPAVKDESEKLIYFSELSKDEISWGMGTSYTKFETKDMEIQLLDVNQDGMNEVLLQNEKASFADGYVGMGCLYNGELRIILVASDIEGYYPKSGIIVEGSMLHGYEVESYWIFKNGNVKELAYKSTDYNSDENGIETYYADKEIEIPDAQETADANNEGDSEYRQLDEESFKKLIKEYVGDEKRIDIDYDAFVENTKENRIDLILQDIPEGYMEVDYQ